MKSYNSVEIVILRDHKLLYANMKRQNISVNDTDINTDIGTLFHRSTFVRHETCKRNVARTYLVT